MRGLFPILCQCCIILTFFFFLSLPKHMWKIVFQSLTYISILSDIKGLFIWLRANCISYSVNSLFIVHIICLLSCWVLVICRRCFYISEINPLWFKLQTFPQIIFLLKRKDKTSCTSPHPCSSPRSSRVWALKGTVWALRISMSQAPK